MSDHEAWIWEALGIEPTRDLGVIKRAYAGALKRRRPEDDVDAYQALRLAYEHAIEIARGRAEAIDDEIIAQEGLEDDASQLVATGAVEMLEETESGADEPDRYSPEFLAASVKHYWDVVGDERVGEIWPQTQSHLDQLPLELRDHASLQFASMVLDSPALPRAIVAPIAEYFGWGKDFRVDRALGEARADAIRSRLLTLGGLRIQDSRVLRRFDPALRIARLIEANFVARAHLLALLTSPRQLERIRETPPDVLARVGLDGLRLVWVVRRLKTAGFIQLFLACLALGFGAGAVGYPAGVAYLLALLGIPVGWWTLGIVSIAILVLDRMQLSLPAGWRRLQSAAPSQRFALALLLIAVATALSLIALPMGGIALLRWIAVALAYTGALVLTWRPGTATRMLILPLIFISAWLLSPIVATGVSYAFVVAGAFVWVLGLQHLLLTRTREIFDAYRTPFFPPTLRAGASSVLARILWCLLFPVTMLAVAPLTFIVQAMRFGIFTALTAWLLTFAIVFEARGDPAIAVSGVVGMPILLWMIFSSSERLGRISWFRPAATD